MSSIITVVGRLGRDAEVKETRNGRQFVSMSVAADRVKRDDERGPIWYDVTIWNGAADNIMEYLKQGTAVTLIGDYDQELYETKNGETRISNRLNSFVVKFPRTGARKNDDNQGGGNEFSAPQQSQGWGASDDNTPW